MALGTSEQKTIHEPLCCRRHIIYVTLALCGSFRPLAFADERGRVSTARSGRCWPPNASPATARTKKSGKRNCGSTFASRLSTAGAIVPGKPDESELLRRIFSGRSGRTDAAAGFRRVADRGTERPASPLDRPRGEVRAALGLRPAAAAGHSHGQQSAVGSQRYRSLCACPTRSGAAVAFRGSRSLYAGPPSVSRPDRPAADARGSGRVRQQ